MLVTKKNLKDFFFTVPPYKLKICVRGTLTKGALAPLKAALFLSLKLEDLLEYLFHQLLYP